MSKFPREMGVFARICFVEVDRWTDVVLNQPDPIEFSLYCKNYSIKPPQANSSSDKDGLLPPRNDK